MRGGRSSPVSIVGLALPFTMTGCAQVVNVAGVYFPGWLIAACVGVGVSYGAMSWLGRRSDTRALSQSGIFFGTLVINVALAVWWFFFSSVSV